MSKKENEKPSELDANFVISQFKNKERRNNPSSMPRALLPPEKEEIEEKNMQEKKSPEEQQEQQTPIAQARETPRKKRGQTNYKETFMRRNEIKTRECVYISHNIHAKIVKLIRALEDTSITIGGYIDTVLSEHLEQHREEINELYRQSREDLL